MVTRKWAEDVWDLLVVGGGTAGIVAATTAAELGARVVLVERDRTGGDCLWTGCVPSKSLLAASAAVADARAAARLGVRVAGVEVDLGAVMRHVHGAISTIEPVDSPDALRAAGVEVVAGEAVLTGPWTAEVNGRVLRFHHAVLATGSRPLLPDLPGLPDSRALTSDTVWDLTELPRRLVVIGGGGSGCELGQAFARLGAQVTLVETEGRVLPQEDPDASALVEAALARDGVEVLTGTTVDAVDPDGPGGSLVLVGGRRVGYDRLLVVAGRRPRTDGIGLDAAGVDVDAHGQVVVDAHLRTSNPRIWAAGDLTGHPQLTHVAGVHGSLAASNAVLGLRRSVDPVVPRVTFTDPEVAAVGAVTSVAPPGGRLRTERHTRVDRAVTQGRSGGFTRIAVDRRGRVVGGTIVGPRAGETVGEVTLAVRHRLRTREVAGTTHPYPTYSDGLWNAAIADTRAALGGRVVRTALHALVVLTRRRAAR